MTEARYQQFSKIVQKGKAHCVIWRGAITSGLLSAFIVIVIRYIDRGALNRGDVIVSFIAGPITGFCVGLWLWHYANWWIRKYEKRHLSGEGTEQD